MFGRRVRLRSVEVAEPTFGRLRAACEAVPEEAYLPNWLEAVQRPGVLAEAVRQVPDDVLAYRAPALLRAVLTEASARRTLRRLRPRVFGPSEAAACGLVRGAVAVFCGDAERALAVAHARAHELYAEDPPVYSSGSGVDFDRALARLTLTEWRDAQTMPLGGLVEYLSCRGVDAAQEHDKEQIGREVERQRQLIRQGAQA